MSCKDQLSIDQEVDAQLAALDFEPRDVTRAVDEAPTKTTPGILTTEFWTTAGTIIANVLGVLSFIGIVNKVDVASLTTEVGSMIAGLQMVLVNGALVWKYLQSRTGLKQATMADNTHRLMLRQRTSLAHHAMRMRYRAAAARET